MDESETSSVLKKIYYDPTSGGSFGGLKKLFDVARIKLPNLTINKTVDWLNKQETYNLYKQVKRNFLRVPILVDHIDEQWQADLLDMSWISKENSNVKYLLTCIDTFSRYAWVRPLKNKNASSIINAFESIFEERRPQKLQTDQGREFINSSFQHLLQSLNIQFFTSTDDIIKCAIVERFNRTLRTRIHRYLHSVNSLHYLNSLEDIVSGYNNSFHRTIQMAPSEVNKNNEAQVLSNIRKSHKKISSYPRPYKKDQLVRITRAKGAFEKGSTSNFTEELFKIVKLKKTPQGYIYHLVDWNNEPITSIFYHYELQPVEAQSLYKIEKVLKSRKNRKTGKTEYFVKWLGYPNTFNSWVEDVQRQ